MTKRSASSAAASPSPPSSAATPSRTMSTGCVPKCSRPASLTATARDLAAEACSYANICETCSNFTTTPSFVPAITAQLDDIRTLRADADERGWTSEIARHGRVIDSLEHHLHRLELRQPDRHSS